MDAPRVRRVVAALPLLAALAAPAVLTGCAGGPPTVGLSGVDGLTIPTPSPDPSDFTDDVDNPWFPLPVGVGLTYRRTEARGTFTERVEASDRTAYVDGVRTRVVTDVVTDATGRVVRTVEHYYAQDDAGNVWLFGTSGAWRAGVDGAEPGLVMAATPRLGDAYLQESGTTTPRQRATVLALGVRREVPYAAYRDLLLVEATTPADPGLVRRSYYARGVGLVLEETVVGGAGIVELVGRG
ncbi:MAG: hypothetical protein ACXVWZ_06725 [Nocardioides sp.]